MSERIFGVAVWRIKMFTPRRVLGGHPDIADREAQIVVERKEGIIDPGLPGDRVRAQLNGKAILAFAEGYIRR